MKTSQLKAITYYVPFVVWERPYRLIIAEVAMYDTTTEDEKHDRIRARAAELSKRYESEVGDFDHYHISTNIADVMKVFPTATIS